MRKSLKGELRSKCSRSGRVQSLTLTKSSQVYKNYAMPQVPALSFRMEISGHVSIPPKSRAGVKGCSSRR